MWIASALLGCGCDRRSSTFLLLLPPSWHPVDRATEMARLKAEKRVLQKQLRAYEDAFKATHGRRVKTAEDRLPRADEYRRYKVGRVSPVCVQPASPDEDLPWRGSLAAPEAGPAATRGRG